MIWTIIIALLVFLISCWLGRKRFIKLEQITGRRVLLVGTFVLLTFLILRYLNDKGYFPEAIAAAFITNVYASVSGFFLGAAFDQYKMKKSLGDIEYVNTAFISDLLPNLIALTLIILGIARTSVFDQQPITPISVAAGVSLLCIGLYAITLRTTPELRQKGFVILDRKIPWKNLISYHWHQEEVIELEFEFNQIIMIHRSVVAAEDEKEVEDILSKKMIERLEKDTEH